MDCGIVKGSQLWFQMVCRFNSAVYAIAAGATKKCAKKDSAHKLLRKLRNLAARPSTTAEIFPDAAKDELCMGQLTALLNTINGDMSNGHGNAAVVTQMQGLTVHSDSTTSWVQPPDRSAFPINSAPAPPERRNFPDALKEAQSLQGGNRFNVFW